VRAAYKDTLIITNGFSCREQILQATGRESLNMAEVVAMALDQGRAGETILATSDAS
jgi:hypothetical protein